MNIALGTDGYGSDLMQKMALAAGLFKDARQDTKIFPAGQALDMATLNGARALQLQNEIGSIAVRARRRTSSCTIRTGRNGDPC